jgi:hypothetical protein
VAQGTCYDWQSRRMSHQIAPEVPVERFSRSARHLNSPMSMTYWCLTASPTPPPRPLR